MKLLHNYLFKTLLFVAAVLSMQSCSCNEEKNDNCATTEQKVTNILSDDVMFAFSGDIDRLFTALDVTVENGVPQLPQYMNDLNNVFLSKSNRQQLDEMLNSLKGLQYSNFIAGVKLNADNAEMLAIFSLDNEVDFANNLTDNGYTKSSDNGYDIFSCDDVQFLLQGKTAYLTFGESEKAVEIVGSWTKAAEQNPLQSWKKDLLVEKHVCTLLCNLNALKNSLTPQQMQAIFTDSTLSKLPFEIWDKTVSIVADLDGTTVSLTSDMFEADGKPMQPGWNGNFDTTLMQYAAESDMIAIGGSLNNDGAKIILDQIDVNIEYIESQLADYGKYYPRSAKEQMDFALQLLKYQRQAVAVVEQYGSDKGYFGSCGLAGQCDLFNFNPLDPANYHVVFAIGLKPEKSAQAFAEICGVLDKVKYGQSTRTGNAYSCKIAIPVGYDSYGNPTNIMIDINMALDGNTLAISNAPIVKNDKNNFDAQLFAGSLGALQIVVPQNHPLLSLAGVDAGIDIRLFFWNNAKSGLTVTTAGAGDKFIPGLCDLLLGFSNR